ncbi:MAG: plastocyanin/azurin family copper-binding protein [Sulfuritalea sp.]|nr:plastocyanin/azurin family copper-binding protein [Sulfuritalea sp.]MDP1981686.1 plastocyanin/azurin family copper-binding protein [Sulfuritalea sp.]
MSAAGCLSKRAPLLLALVALAASAQQTVEVTIQDYKFQPAEVRIKVGDTVKWINREKRTSHSVLFPAENGLESERMFPLEHWQRTFTQPGSYRYRCGPHEEMQGLVLVD